MPHGRRPTHQKQAWQYWHVLEHMPGSGEYHILVTIPRQVEDISIS